MSEPRRAPGASRSTREAARAALQELARDINALDQHGLDDGSNAVRLSDIVRLIGEHITKHR